MKTKYRTSEAFNGAIVAGDQNEDGTMFAYAIGYDWQGGAKG